MIPKFTRGPKALIDRLNQIIDIVNIKWASSTFINIKKIGNTYQADLDFNKLVSRLPHLSGVGSARSVWAKVIESLLYADPASFSLSGGRAYYTLRLVGTTETVWDDETEYDIDALVCYPDADSPMYKSKQAENTGNQPDISPDWWEKQDEIRVEHALDKDDTDLRLFVPWFEVGSIVPVVSRVVDEETRYYINLCLTYCGEHSEASIRWNETEGRAMACFK